MNFFSNIIDTVKRKKAEMDDRRQFLDMVEEKVKPVRRAAYMQQMYKEVLKEGIEKAKLDAEKRVPKKTKSPEDFGIKKEQDPWGYLDTIGIAKKDKTLIKSTKKKK